MKEGVDIFMVLLYFLIICIFTYSSPVGNFKHIIGIWVFTLLIYFVTVDKKINMKAVRVVIIFLFLLDGFLLIYNKWL